MKGVVDYNKFDFFQTCHFLLRLDNQNLKILLLTNNINNSITPFFSNFSNMFMHYYINKVKKTNRIELFGNHQFKRLNKEICINKSLGGDKNLLFSRLFHYKKIEREVISILLLLKRIFLI